MVQLKVHIETFGCQMNKLDSETAAERLLAAGFAKADTPEDADVILFASTRAWARSNVRSSDGPS